jgi:kynurenine formamidase
MRVLKSAAVATACATALAVWSLHTHTTAASRKTIATEEEFRQAMKDLSNWNRWGPDDELGAANLITPAKRRQAAALVKEGLPVSMEHPIFQEDVLDGSGHLERTVVSARPGGTSDKYAFTGSYHGSIGTAVHREDLEALEKIEHVKVTEGDVILLYTGRWKRRAAVGPWKTSEGVAGYHADVAFFLKERGVSFIGDDEWNDVSPTTLPQAVGLPVHKLALIALGVDIFDNLDLERVVETARRLNRYEFMFTAAPLVIEKGTGSPLNPLAIF